MKLKKKSFHVALSYLSGSLKQQRSLLQRVQSSHQRVVTSGLDLLCSLRG